MPNQLSISIRNTTGSPGYMYITGRAASGNLCIIEADGKTPYFPSSPSVAGTPLEVNCAIPLSQPNSTINVVIPQLSASRVWFSLQTTLTFLLNPGPGLVEPSVTNPSDPNINTLWGFCELTFNEYQLYANISYVDFVSIPIALTLTNASGNTQVVRGLPRDGLDQVCQGLRSQSAADGKGWNQLIVKSPSGQIIRALSPNLGQVLNSSLFAGYYEPYVDAVWSKYKSTPLTIDTQASFGAVRGSITGNVLTFPNVGTYGKPSTSDIFTCSTGPFMTSTAGLAALTPRISAAFNRSTLLTQSVEPSSVGTYYQDFVTNHYSRIVHETNLDRRGYAFPYDDVAPSGGQDQSGSVFDSNPILLAITLGGGAISLNAMSQIKAASFDNNNGIINQPTSDSDGGLNCAYIANGDWIGFDSVDFGSGVNVFSVRVASGAGSGISGLVQLVIDDLNTTPISTFSVANTGGWQTWTTIRMTMNTRISGTHAIWIRFSSGQAQDFVNVNWFTFNAALSIASTQTKSVATTPEATARVVVASPAKPRTSRLQSFKKFFKLSRSKSVKA